VTTSVPAPTRKALRHQRCIGALIGSVVGDALGAPFEFGPADQYTGRFPTSVRRLRTEMCGGSVWRPGEWTDDTQMALHTAASLLQHDGLDEADLFSRYQSWVNADPADVGIQTRQVLTSGLPWRTAAAAHFKTTGHAAGNGSLMRTTPAAIFFASQGQQATADAARRISALTHGDPAAGEGCAIFHRLVATALDDDDPLTQLDAALADVEEAARAKWAAVLDEAWTPDQATESNGAVWPTLGTAVWALRHYGEDFEAAMRAVIDLGGDTDTVAAVTGGLLGATYGIQVIPSRWASAVRGQVPGQEPPIATDLAGLQAVAKQLSGEAPAPPAPSIHHGIDPVQVLSGLWLSDLGCAPRAPKDAVVISLCRTYGHIKHQNRRQVYLTDDDNNMHVDRVLDDVLNDIEGLQSDGHAVVVHCHGGASRTGLILRGWLQRTQGLSPRAATREATRLWPHTYTGNDSFSRALTRLSPPSQAPRPDELRDE
jgi:ADP-ribosyl-[dinitrogen reductase] hydrolase